MNTWTDNVFYRGIGHTITHPLFPIPQSDGSNPAPVADPEDYVPLINGSFRIKEININGTTTGLLVEWVSLDDESPKSYVLHGKQIDEDMPPLLYSKNFDEYALFIQFMAEVTSLNDVPSNDTLGTKDSALIGKLVDSLPAINADITANNAAQAASPPPPPMQGGKKFYRIRKFFTDSDQDGLQDHIEAQQGLNMWNWDSDGDGISDSQDQNPLVNDAIADPDGSGLPSSLDNGLLARYDFEVLGSGTFTDKSGNNQHATANGNTAVDSLGMVSRAAKLGGSGYLSAASMLHGHANHSLSFWICPEKDSILNSNGSYRTIHATTALSTGVAQSRFFGVCKSNGNEVWVLGDYQWNYNGGSPTSSITGLNWTMPLGSSDSGKWHHVVTVQSGNTAKVYVDGIEVVSGALAAIPPPAGINATTNFIVGRTLPASSVTQFEGKIDRMRVYGRALSAAEVTLIHNQDVDHDGLHDRGEVKSLLWRDTNGDGIRTNAESSYLINPFRHDPASSDHDGDGLSSLDEQNTHGTDMTNPDSDKDLIPDGWEVDSGLNPLLNDASGDPDGDTVTNINEYVYKADPQLSDTDGDTTDDSTEISQGSNPHDDSDGGNPIPPEEKLTIKIGVGDRSGSESEDYVMNIFRLNPETGAEEPFYTLRSGGHGQYEEETLSIFKKSDTYAFQIDWQSTSGTNSGDANNPEGADYDYTFVVEPQNDDTGTLVDQYDPDLKRADADKPIGGEKNDVDDFPQSVESKEIRRVPIQFLVPVVDANGKEVKPKKRVVAKELKVGKLLGGQAVGIDLNLDKDVDRFYIKVEGLDPNAVVSVKLGTEHPTPEYADNFTEIELKYSASKKYHISTSQLLVSDTTDDVYTQASVTFPEDDIVADNTKNDRTHIVALGGTVKINKYIVDGVEKNLNVKLPVKVRRKIDVKVINLKKPDGTLLVPAQKITADIKAMKECLAQIGIQANVVTVQKDIPAGVDMSNGLQIPDLPDPNAPPQVPAMTDEETALLDGVATAVINDLEVVYVPQISDISTPNEISSLGYAYNPSRFTNPAHTKYHNTLIVAGNAKLYVHAHELGHILLDDEHHHNHGADDASNLMSVSVNQGNLTTTDGSKRLSQEQETRMYENPLVKPINN